MQLPTAEIIAPGSTRSRSLVLLSRPAFSQHGPSSRHIILHNHLSPAAVCRLSSSAPWSAWSSLLLIVHLPPATYPFPSMSASHYIKPATSILPPSLLISLMTYVIPRHLSRLSSFLLRPCGCGPVIPSPYPTSRVGLHTRPSSYSVIPGGSTRSLPCPKMLSWPGRLQSQEAVIEAVGGG
jgi:hypothetical protein